MRRDHADDDAEARRRDAHAVLQSEAIAHWAQADELLGEADAALRRVARFIDDEDQAAVVLEAWADAHTADAGALRAMAANLYSPSAPGGPTMVPRAAPPPRSAARPQPVQQTRRALR
jgi:hypothetical protein